MAKLRRSENRMRRTRATEPEADDHGDAAQTVGRWRKARDKVSHETDQERYLVPYPTGCATAVRLWRLCRHHLDGAYTRADLVEARAILDLWGLAQDLQIQAIEDVRALDAARNTGVNEERELWSD